MAYRLADAYEQALAFLYEALTASRGMRDDRHAADTLYHLGTVAWSNGRNDLSITHHQQAGDICEELRLMELVAVQAFHGRGEAYFANAQPAAAIRSFSRSLELARGIADMSDESENLMMIGWACIGQMGLGDYARALSHFDAALDIARSADLQWHPGPKLIGRAHAQMALGRFGDAWAALNDALPRLETLRLARYQMTAHDALGCLLLDLNLDQRASEHFERGLALGHDAGIMYWRPRLQANVLIAQLRIGGPVDPAALQATLRQTQEHSEAWQTLRCLEALAESALAAGFPGTAARHSHTPPRHSVTMSKATGGRPAQAQLRRTLYKIWLAPASRPALAQIDAAFARRVHHQTNPRNSTKPLIASTTPPTARPTALTDICSGPGKRRTLVFHSNVIGNNASTINSTGTSHRSNARHAGTSAETLFSNRPAVRGRD